MSTIKIIEWYDDIIKAIIDIDSKIYIFTLVFKNGNIKTYFGIPISEFIESKKIIQLLNNGITKENYALFLKLLKKVNSNNNPLLIITEDLTSENLTPIKFKKDNKWLNDFFHIEYPKILEKASKYENWDIY